MEQHARRSKIPTIAKKIKEKTKKHDNDEKHLSKAAYIHISISISPLEGKRGKSESYCPFAGLPLKAGVLHG